jgi:hypothetical protein
MKTNYATGSAEQISAGLCGYRTGDAETSIAWCSETIHMEAAPNKFGWSPCETIHMEAAPNKFGWSPCETIHMEVET